MILPNNKALSMATLFKVLRKLDIKYTGSLMLSRKMDLGSEHYSVWLWDMYK